MLGFWLAWSCGGLVHAVPANVKFTCYFATDVYYLWLLKPLFPPFCDSSWALGGRDVNSCPSYSWVLQAPYSLYISQLWVSVLVTIYCKKKHLWGGLKDELILEGSLIWCPFNRIIGLGSLLGLWTTQPQLTVPGMRSICRMGFNLNEKVVGHFHNICATTIQVGISY